MNWIIEKIPGLRDIKADPEEITKKYGVMGEPLTLGTILGVLLGILAGNVPVAQLVAAVEDAIDRMKTSPTPVPVILVGGMQKPERFARQLPQGLIHSHWKSFIWKTSRWRICRGMPVDSRKGGRAFAGMTTKLIA
ncbi:hypothetical protein [Brevibacillus parabrevis]|uniref:hypothetical protein n=1 Tax=Brevibacillus parabrevis TaxID=54914 RepID=UPI00399CE25C